MRTAFPHPAARLALASALFVLGAGTARAGQPAPQAPTATAVENALPGSAGWQGPAAAEAAIQGYASEPGAVGGDTVHFHVSTRPAARYRIELYRLGWYAGAGGRLVACSPNCSGDAQGHAYGGQTGDGVSVPIRANWPVTDTIVVQPDWPSGYYLARFLLLDGPQAGRAATSFVIVRQPAGAAPSQIVVQVPVNTWQAYNEWGGRSLYDGGDQRGTRVSFERPYGRDAQSPLWYELQLVRFLEREGYDVSYQTDQDTSFHPESLLRHRLAIVAGHDEYWTKQMRDGFEAARDGGTNLAFLGSNQAYWQVRYEDNGNTIYSAKSLYDPEQSRTLKTAMFREIGRPECELMGVHHESLPRYTHALDFHVAAPGDPWFWNTGFGPGDVVTGVVGREYDKLAPWGDCAHPGTVVLFHYQGGPMDPNADAVRFSAASGARIFAAGAQRFTWGLDDWRSSLDSKDRPVPADPRLQQFMRNALDDLTRPAAPTGLQVVRSGTSVTVSVNPSSDPRVVTFAAGRKENGRWIRICRGTVSCTGTVPPGPLEIGAVVCDAWHRRSAPAYANVP